MSRSWSQNKRDSIWMMIRKHLNVKCKFMLRIFCSKCGGRIKVRELLSRLMSMNGTYFRRLSMLCNINKLSVVKNNSKSDLSLRCFQMNNEYHLISLNCQGIRSSRRCRCSYAELGSWIINQVSQVKSWQRISYINHVSSPVKALLWPLCPLLAKKHERPIFFWKILFHSYSYFYLPLEFFPLATFTRTPLVLVLALTYPAFGSASLWLRPFLHQVQPRQSRDTI